MVDLSGSINEETTPSDIIIAVMGPTGTGKSSFIKSVTGDETIQIGSSLNSSTQEFGVYSAVIDGRRVEFVDTPGFEDTRDENSDADILQELAAFLMQTYHDRKLFNAVIYMHRISDPRLGKITKRNLRLFTKICGGTSLQNVVIVTTFWDSVNGVVGATREDELRATFFKPLLDGGARIVRLDRGVLSARKIISDITKNQPRACNYSKN
ncbi:GTP-binding protein A [Grifola frondosa]|uniref:GTP-binding protein A n=1 Tax=Grifola frondosa TaxID=5627 RepID=A0A1C7M5M8_GRIFR|nr:GTP-binding protein A [Grifola frondosa]